MFSYRRRRALAYIAVLIWAAQYCVSFGHIHDNSLNGNALSRQQHQGCEASRDAPSAPTHDEDDCPICRTLHIAATLVQPSPPAIFVIERVTDARFGEPASPPALRPAFRSFRARGPPNSA